MLESKVLLAGFEPFGPYRNNVAEQLVDSLGGKVIEINDLTRIQIIGLKLPIHFGTFREVLENAIKEIQPIVAIGLGMDFKDLKHLSLELLAHSEPQYGTDIKDTEGKVGPIGSLDELPRVIRVPNESQITRTVSEVTGIEVSENAGGHMCETVLRDLIRLSEDGAQFQPAFIHLPHTPDLLADSRLLSAHTNSMPLEQQREIVEKIIRKLSALYLNETDEDKH